MADGGRAAKQSSSGKQASSKAAPISGAPASSPLHQNLSRLQGAAGNRAVQREVTDEQIDAMLAKQKAERAQELTSMESAGAIVNKINPTPQTYAKPTQDWDAPTRSRSDAVTGSAPASASGSPAPLALPAKYKDEDKKAGWRAHFGAAPDESAEMQARRAAGAETTGIRTDYHTPEQQAANTLKPVDGKLMAGDKAAEVAPFEHTFLNGATSMAPTEYAMSPGGDVVANLGKGDMEKTTLPSGQAQTVTTHHSSLLAGGDVAHAGHIGVAGGKVNYLDDDSGHYRPSEAHTYDAFSRLSGQGVLDPTSTSGQVKMVDKKGQKGVDQGAALSVPFAHYSQSGGNEAGMRAKSDVVGDFKARAEKAGLAPKAEGGGGGMVFEEGSSYGAYGGLGGAAATPSVYGAYGGLGGDAAAAGGVAPTTSSYGSNYNAGAYQDIAPAAPVAGAAPITPMAAPTPSVPAPPASASGGFYGQYGSLGMAPASSVAPPSSYAPSLAPMTPAPPAAPAPDASAYSSSLAPTPPASAPAPQTPGAGSQYSQYGGFLPPERR